MLSESYRKRIKQLAGITNEEVSISSDGTLQGFQAEGEISGEQAMIYSVTYEIITHESAEQGDAEDRGFEVEPVVGPLSEIIDLGRHTYGTSEATSSPVMVGCSWTSPDPVNDRNYFEKGESKYYGLHIKHIDGKDLSQEEAVFINDALKGKMKWDDIDNKWI